MKRISLVAVYGLMFLLFLFKMFYYREELHYVPDEEAHISYLAYVQENPGKWLPEFEHMGLCEGGVNVGDGIYEYEIQDRICYLGHPPLYYKLMNLIGGVVTQQTEEGHYVYADLDRLKTANIYLTGLTMILILYIGFTRLGKYTQSPVWHGLYAASAVSVPMLALCGSGITNDNLANLGVAVFMLGALRYFERKKGYLTYFLVAGGFFLSIMSKLTVGEFIVIVLAVILIADVIRNKNLGLIWNRYFAATLPVYLLAGLYFILLLAQYGSIQPGLDVVAPVQQAFVPEAERPDMSFLAYTSYFLQRFSYTWTGIYNGRFYDFKMFDGAAGAGYLWLFAAPFLFAGAAAAVALCRRGAKNGQAGSGYSILYAAAAAGLFITVATQLVKGYGSFTDRGYMGGYQARYYLCNIPFMALAAAEGLYWLSAWNPYRLLTACAERMAFLERPLGALGEGGCRAIVRTVWSVAGVIGILWLLYGDFIYFLLVHNVY